MERYGPEYGLPQPYSGHMSYAEWGPPPDSAVGRVVVVGVRHPAFTGCRRGHDARGRHRERGGRHRGGGMRPGELVTGVARSASLLRLNDSRSPSQAFTGNCQTVFPGPVPPMCGRNCGLSALTRRPRCRPVAPGRAKRCAAGGRTASSVRRERLHRPRGVLAYHRGGGPSPRDAGHPDRRVRPHRRGGDPNLPGRAVGQRGPGQSRSPDESDARHRLHLRRRPRRRQPRPRNRPDRSRGTSSVDVHQFR